ncbi:UDP-N-acetylmuramoylalanyl-D-glutamyl-2,6-diaminopimelate--D-alanyl-D-alanine ligase [Fimbriimonas ginsengisoli Gsoil 348]|uniref:UDP-N-acetylmuramoyl-tripeptide--D-alanyl-D-alanine ligase n=1 Tax=Fimbriimonas ginsengisoli Gsoil 348 TaxID=661478 RepID=A0A068NXB1_FIMGI|nr:UDP-N-acetylmuramoylalanyl-D-glutamyl-2,6-diaminopimelate--D-alanyl-D-alanine ligase [Fimbriimonas ginsengisoli Gsoil 348]
MLADLLQGKLSGDPDLRVTGFATDSGGGKPGDLFLAIKGARVDGHEFVAEALRTGAVAAVVERPVDGPHILVENLVDALARMGSTLRSGFDGPVIAITGSAGKTTTKEFVAAALSPLGSVLKSEGNRNTEYTSPLLWMDLEPDHRAVVVEMAMRGFGQIRHLAEFTRPTDALITNIGYSHLEQVGSREGIADAKGELLETLPENGVAILWHEDEFLERLSKKTKAKVRTFGYDPGADCLITSYRALDWDACEVGGTLDGIPWEARLPAVGKHIGLNAAAAVLTVAGLGVAPQEAAEALKGARIPPMRMEIVEHRGARVLLDTYNASPPSMIAAIETLSDLPATGRRRAVIGEMRELGDHREAAHRLVGQALAQNGLDEVILFGEPVHFVREAAMEAGMEASHIGIADSIDDVRAFLDRTEPGDAILIKGSRALELERALKP